MIGVQIETHGNPQYLTVHTRTKLANEQHLMLKHKSSRSDMDEKQCSLVHDLLAIPGMTDVSLYMYSLTLEKAYMFSWKEMESAINDVLQKYALE